MKREERKKEEERETKRKIREREERMSKRERRLTETLIEEGIGAMVRTEEIIRRVYEIEADESSKNAIRIMIYRVNKKLRRIKVRIKNRKGIGYYIKKEGE